MSPLYIEIALHYHCRTDDFPRLDAPAVKSALIDFVSSGLLRPQSDAPGTRRNYEPTDGLAVWVEALRAVPWPKQVWAIPSNT